MALKQKSSSKVFNFFFCTIFFITLFSIFLTFCGLFLQVRASDFLEILRDEEFLFALSFTAKTTLTATCLATLCAIPSAYFLARHDFKLKLFVDTILDLPMVLPPLVSGVALLILFAQTLHMPLAVLGLDFVFTPLGAIVAQWFVATPFAIRTFKNAFDSMDIRLEKIARTLGCTPFKTFWKVTIPMCKNSIIVGIILCWTRTVGEFGATAMLAGVTRMKTETLAAAIFLNMSMGNFQFSIAIAIIMIVLSLFILLLFKRITS